MSDDFGPEEKGAEEKTFETNRRETEEKVRSVEDAAGKGLVSRKQADRLIETGQKVHRSHDMARGLRQRSD